MAIHFSEEQLKNKGGGEKETEKDIKYFIAKADKFLEKISRVPLKEKLFFVQHLGLMLKAGISLSSALKTLAKQSGNKFFVKVLNDVADRVEKGNSFADSLNVYNKVFGELFINMIEVGESSGKLEEVLNQLFIQMKKEHALISKVKGALTYPTVIIFAMLLIGTFMITVIVPKITSSFLEMNVELPLATKILIKISSLLVHNGLIVAVGLVLFIIILVQVIRTKKGKSVLDTILLKTPIVGPIIKKINLARFARNISALLKTDIMIIKTFQITANILGNVHYKNSLLDMAQKIKKGERLNEAIQTYPKLYPPIVVQMIAVGEETGELDGILVELAEFYEEEVDAIMGNLPAIIEPLLILLLGLGVGGVAIAIIMPMYSLTDAI
ncbi:MAG: type II secretion system F family protein [bacterium]